MTPEELKAISRDDFRDDEAGRLALLDAAQKLCLRLETPKESVKRMTFQEPTLNMALRIADELQIFTELGKHGSEPKEIATLASPTGADPELLKRILRHCAAKLVVIEHPGDKYQATELSELLATKEGISGIHCVAHKFYPIFQDAPDYLRSTGFQVPRNVRDGVHQHSKVGKVGESHFEWMELPVNKRVAQDFNLLMRFGAAGDRPWVEVFPTEDLIQGFESSAPLLVDVGGSLGHQALVFKEKHNDLTGQIIVQDLPTVIAQARQEKQASDIEFQEYDFFKPQPVHGAKIYFMGHVLHDWPDQDAKTILKNTVAAMKHGYSSLVLREKVLPDTGCPPTLSAIDLVMMAELASHERSDKQWEALLADQGLKLKKIVPITGTEDSVLYAVPA